MGTRGRILLVTIVAAWLGAIVVILLTSPPGGADAPAPRGHDLHMYAAAAVFFAGLAALPLVFWLVARRERGPREVHWRALILGGALAAVAIGAWGVNIAVHPPYTDGRPDGTVAAFAGVALLVFLAACMAANRAMPRQPKT